MKTTNFPKATIVFLLLAGLNLINQSPLFSQTEKDREYSECFKEGLKAFDEKRLDDVIEIYEKCLRIKPQSSGSAYNLACAYALKKETKLAMDWLNTSRFWGYLSTAEYLWKVKADSDLDYIRDDPRYHAIIQRAEAAIRDNPSDNPEKILERNNQLVVMLKSDLGFGAGILVGKDAKRLYIATANHVVRMGPNAAEDLTVAFYKNPDKWITAEVLEQFDKDLDLAVVAVPADAVDFSLCDLPLSVLPPSKTVDRGTLVYPIGNPNAISWVIPLEPDKVARHTGSEITFQSNFIKRGHSGGVLFTETGELLGMIKADEPPFGLATDFTTVITQIKKWGYPVQLQGRSENSTTPLHTAVAKNDLQAARQLLGECISLDVWDENGETALHKAIQQGNLPMVELLIAAGANVNLWSRVEYPIKRDKYLKNGLHLAIDKNNPEIVGALLKAGAHPNDDIINTEYLYEKIDKRPRNNFTFYYSYTPMDLAAMQNAVPVGRLLVEHGAKIETSGSRSPILYAVESNAPEFIQLLVENGANINKTYFFDVPLYLAIKKNHREAVEALIKLGADLDFKNNGDNPLLIAVYESNAPMVKLLLESGADPNNTCALSSAAGRGNLEIVKILVKAGADLDEGERCGYAPLFDAVRNDEVAVAKYLISAGADIHIKDRRQTLLYQAWNKKSLEMVKVLVTAGARINEKDKDGNTFLDNLGSGDYWDKTQKEIVRYLKSKGATGGE